MPRWLALLVLLPQCTGCLYYAYPTLSHTPELVIDNHDGSARLLEHGHERTINRQRDGDDAAGPDQRPRGLDEHPVGAVEIGRGMREKNAGWT